MNYGLAIVALLAAACGSAPRTYAECKRACGELGVNAFYPGDHRSCVCRTSATEIYERREALQ